MEDKTEFDNIVRPMAAERDDHHSVILFDDSIVLQDDKADQVMVIKLPEDLASSIREENDMAQEVLLNSLKPTLEVCSYLIEHSLAFSQETLASPSGFEIWARLIYKKGQLTPRVRQGCTPPTMLTD